jgi:thiamine biosynthesis lipoprotein
MGYGNFLDSFFMNALIGSTLAALLLVSGCAKRPTQEERHWFAMDTDFSATVYLGTKWAAIRAGEHSGDQRPGSGYGKPLVDPADAFAQLQAEGESLERIFSDYLPASSLRRLQGRAGDTLTPDPGIYAVFKAAAEMASASRGSFDIALHDLKSVWGLSSGDSARIPSDSALAWAMRGNPAYLAPVDSNPALRPPFVLLSDGRMVLLRDSAVFDLGGIAKGYAVDRMHRILDSLGYPVHLLKAGGDMLMGGSKDDEPWRLGIRHPRSTGRLAGTLLMETNAYPAVSTSGDYERFFIRDGARYHHIFDPRTARPARPYCSVTVLAKNSLLADRLTKPLFILGPVAGAELLRRFGAEAVWMRESGAAGTDSTGALCHLASPGMQGILEMSQIPICPALP